MRSFFNRKTVQGTMYYEIYNVYFVKLYLHESFKNVKFC